MQTYLRPTMKLAIVYNLVAKLREIKPHGLDCTKLLLPNGLDALELLQDEARCWT